MQSQTWPYQGWVVQRVALYFPWVLAVIILCSLKRCPNTVKLQSYTLFGCLIACEIPNFASIEGKLSSYISGLSLGALVCENAGPNSALLWVITNHAMLYFSCNPKLALLKVTWSLVVLYFLWMLWFMQSEFWLYQCWILCGLGVNSLGHLHGV